MKILPYVSVALMGLGFLLELAPATSAAPQPGLWQESVTQADGVTVRKIRDTTGGELNVCYVASRMLPGGSYTNAPSVAVAISCLPERKP